MLSIADKAKLMLSLWHSFKSKKLICGRGSGVCPCCSLVRLVGGAGGADGGCEPQRERDGAGGQHLLQPAGGAREDSPGGAAGV